MGNNVVYVSNQTGRKMTCLSFNNSDCVYLYYRELIQVPVGGEPAHLDGLQGGGAVQVAVVYDINSLTGRLIYDLFQVDHGATITITDVDDQSGVKNKPKVTGDHVRLLATGRSIRAGSDHTAGVASAVSMVGGIAGATNQSTLLGKPILTGVEMAIAAVSS